MQKEEVAERLTSGASSSLAIRLFGPLDVRLNGAPLPRLRSRKGEWLLTLLTLRSNRAVDRGWLAGTLWPESSTSRGLFYLRRELTHLRHALGAEAVRLRSPDPQTLSLDLAGAWVDLVAFDEAIARGSATERSEVGVPLLEEAVSLYRGPVPEGWVEPWVLPERESREQAYLGALETLATWASDQGDPPRAVSYLRRAVALDPLRESVQRGLIEALAARGDYAAATLVYRDLRLLLHREIGAEPSPETTALFHRNASWAGCAMLSARRRSPLRGQRGARCRWSGR